jgi:hypothetical protein
MRLTATLRQAIVAAAVCNVLANAVTARLLPRVSRQLLGSSWPGVVASLFWIATARLMPAWDCGFTVLGLTALCILCTSDSFAAGRLRDWWTSALLAALLVLLNPSTVLVMLPLAAWAALRCVHPLRCAAIHLAAVAFLVLPWMARNHHQLGAYVLRTNFGISLYAANNDCASPDMLTDELSGCYQATHPNLSAAQDLRVRALGEIRYDRLQKDAAESWIRTHPRRFIHLTLTRIREFWFPPLADQPLTALLVWLGTVLSIPGVILMLLHRRRAALFVVPALLLLPALYYVILSDIRYRYPILWLSYLPAGYLAHQLLIRAQRFRSRRVQAHGDERIGECLAETADLSVI